MGDNDTNEKEMRNEMTTTYTTSEEIFCECCRAFALEITVTYDEEGFGDIPVFHNTMENICAECLDEIKSDASFLNVVVEPLPYLF